MQLNDCAHSMQPSGIPSPFSRWLRYPKPYWQPVGDEEGLVISTSAAFGVWFGTAVSRWVEMGICLNSAASSGLFISFLSASLLSVSDVSSTSAVFISRAIAFCFGTFFDSGAFGFLSRGCLAARTIWISSSSANSLMLTRVWQSGQTWYVITFGL